MQALHILISSPWFWASLALSGLGGVVVAWGLRVEKLAERKLPPPDFKTDIFEDVVEEAKRGIERGWRILMTGIIIEVVAAFAISVISGLEVADLTLEARQAEIVAGQANEQAANTYSNSLVLQKQVLDSSNRLAETESFAARIRMSLITSSWMYFDDKKFVADLKDKPKGGVVIFVRPNDEDALLLAVKFEQALKQAGWSASDPKPIDADELLKNPTFENGISSVSKEQFDMRAIMLEKPNVKPGVPFSWMDLEKTDTPARALWASMQDSGIMCGLMMTDPALPDNMLKIVIGRKML